MSLWEQRLNLTGPVNLVISTTYCQHTHNSCSYMTGKYNRTLLRQTKSTWQCRSGREDLSLESLKPIHPRTIHRSEEPKNFHRKFHGLNEKKKKPRV